MKKKHIALLLICCMALLFAGCTTKENSAKEATPTATVLPEEPKGILGILDSIDQSVQTVLMYAKMAQASEKGAYNVMVPFQNIELIKQAFIDFKKPKAENGVYSFTVINEGTHTYGNPNSGINPNVNTSSYTIEGEGDALEETIENTYYDPMGFVLAPSGGGFVSYVTTILMQEDLSRATYDKKSTLDGEITGITHFEYAFLNDSLCFVEARLNLSLEQTADSYNWMILVGRVGTGGAKIFEYSLTTTSPTLPKGIPSLYVDKALNIDASIEQHKATQLSLLEVGNGGV